MKRFVFVGLLVWFALLTVTSVQANHTKDTLDDVERNLTARRAVLVDVREYSETNKGYVDGAILVPLSLLEEGSGDEQFQAVLAQRLPPQAIVYIYCATGKRCRKAAAVLANYGYDARPLKYGFADLAREGFVTAKPKR